MYIYMCIYAHRYMFITAGYNDWVLKWKNIPNLDTVPIYLIHNLMSTTQRCRIFSVMSVVILHHQYVDQCTQPLSFTLCAIHALWQAYWPQFAPKQAARGLSADDLQTQFGLILQTAPLVDAGSPFLLHKALTSRQAETPITEWTGYEQIGKNGSGSYLSIYIYIYVYMYMQ